LEETQALEISHLHFPNPPAMKRRPDADYRFLPLSGIIRARMAIFGENKDEDGPASMYTICISKMAPGSLWTWGVKRTVGIPSWTAGRGVAQPEPLQADRPLLRGIPGAGSPQRWKLLLVEARELIAPILFE
jgi:hypothetical protein